MKYFQLVILIFARTAFGQCDEDEVEIWGNCYDISSTYELDLSSSGINDTIPWEIGSLLNLFSINLSNNQISGSIPETIGNLSNLLGLDL